MTQPEPQVCNHDDSEWWCIACGKPAFYENLCYDCGPVYTRKCLNCEEEFDVAI